MSGFVGYYISMIQGETDSMTQNYFTSQQFANELGITVRTLERWRSDNKLIPAMRTRGNHSRYSKEQLCQLKSQRVEISLEDLIQ